MTDIILNILQWAIPSGGIGAAIAWIANRKVKECSFLYLVDYIVSYSYCKLTIIFSIPNSTCQSSILFLVSIYILHSSS